MNDQQQAGQQSAPNTAQYEDEFGAGADDLNLIAAFAKRVGNELYTVDHQNVGSNSSIKALQLDQKKIFEKLPQAPPSRESKPVEAVAKIPEVKNSPEPQKVVKRTPVKPTQNVVVSDDVTNIEKRLTKIESTIGALRKAKRIKRGVTYSVSSNGFKGEIKDAELLAEFVITEVAKGVKTITIRANDSQNSK